jgi:nicotinamidase/pyrazinamidase
MLRYHPGVALIVVDVQNDFADPAGSRSVRDDAEVVPIVNREAALARNNGAIVAHSQDWHPEPTPSFAADGGTRPAHCVRDTWAAALHPDLEVQNDAPVIRKGSNGEDGYSTFTMRDPQTSHTIPTELEQLLRDADVNHAVVVGLATGYCVGATTADAVPLGFATTVLTDAVAAVDLRPGEGERALASLRNVGILLHSTRMR